MSWRREDGYWVSDDRDHLDLDLIHRWLSEELLGTGPVARSGETIHPVVCDIGLLHDER